MLPAAAIVCSGELPRTVIGKFVSRHCQDIIGLDAALGASHKMAQVSGGSKTEKEAEEHDA